MSVRGAWGGRGAERTSGRSKASVAKPEGRRALCHPTTRSTPQPRQSGWVRRVRSTRVPGGSSQAKSWALDPELKQGRWGRASTPDGQTVRVSTSTAEGSAELLWGWTGSPSVARPMSFRLCPACKGLGGGGASCCPHPGQPKLTASQQCSVRGGYTGPPHLDPYPGGSSLSEACCSAQQALWLRPGGGGPAARFPAPGVWGRHIASPCSTGATRPPVSATPGSFHRGMHGLGEQAGGGPVHQSRLPSSVCGEASELLLLDAQGHGGGSKPSGRQGSTRPLRLTAQGLLTAAQHVTAQPSCGQWAAGRQERRDAPRGHGLA